MAIAPTGAIYKSLIFDGEDSRNYGVYITGQAVFNAPEREVEMITIPARNGAFALDQGRFENIEVTYPAGIFADTEADFAQAISDFRNFLCSRKGYCRLTDDYNPDEYRMAIYKDGLDVKLSELKAGEFTITFNCKPQRFLTSGDTAVTVANGGTITNPTLFESRPLLEADGYGDINIGSSVITIQNSVYGLIPISRAKSGNNSISISLDTSNLMTGDSINVSGIKTTFVFTINDPTTYRFVDQNPVTSASGCTTTYSMNDKQTMVVRLRPDDAIFSMGTSIVISPHANLSLMIQKISTQTQYTISDIATVVINYNGASRITISADPMSGDSRLSNRNSLSCPILYGDSSKSSLGSPTYIDLDLGDAYTINGGSIVSVNNSVSIPPEMPTLPSGNTIITYDNTITNLKIVPRWWKI